ncbi:hypothetical protein EYZ11_006594 [Aspergillus tanneri]|uniref:Uncharacterized protein n=1 Tax=Aspergillus tanneri TaxID=1220188 RepID=A0A4S3JFD0_9EURO|nr:hypothetical protein EYZ11_006594 [Aspergillus tanneri]
MAWLTPTVSLCLPQQAISSHTSRTIELRSARERQIGSDTHPDSDHCSEGFSHADMTSAAG